MSNRAKAEGWVIVAYDLPNEPSRLRVKAWRNFKKLGGIYPSVSLCILPDTDTVRAELAKMRSGFAREGMMLRLESKALGNEDNELLLRMFKLDRQKQIEEILEECQEFIDEVEENIGSKKVTFEETDELEQALEGLERWFAEIKARGFSSEENYSRVDEAISACRKALSRFADKAQPRGLNR